MNAAFYVSDEDFPAVERGRSACYLSTAIVEAVPAFVRHMEPLNRAHRHESKYARFGCGPRNKSGRARS